MLFSQVWRYMWGSPLFRHNNMMPQALARALTVYFVPMTRSRLVLLPLLLLTTAAHAQMGGSSTFNFLNLVPSSRVAAMGGYMNTIRDSDLDLVLYNPAILDTGMHKHMVLDFTNFYGGVNYGYAGYAHNLKKVGPMAFGILYANYGSATMTNEFGEAMGTTSSNDLAVHASWAKGFGKYFSAGVTAKLIYSNLAGYNALGLAGDIGAMFHHPTNWTIGLTLRNAGGQLVSYSGNGGEPLPLRLELGVSKKLKYVPLRISVMIKDLQRMDLTYRDPTNSGPDVDPLTGEAIEYSPNVGDAIMRHFVFSGELTILRRIMLRMGYNYGRRQEMKVSTSPATVGFSWGVGVKINRFTINYSRATYHLAGGTNQISIAVNLGVHKPIPKPVKQEKTSKKKKTEEAAPASGGSGQ